MIRSTHASGTHINNKNIIFYNNDNTLLSLSFSRRFEGRRREYSTNYVRVYRDNYNIQQQ